MIITISREFGSGGSEIGHKLADKLGIPCYDKTVSELTACLVGMPDKVVRESQDKFSNNLDHIGGFGYGLYSRNIFLPIYDQIFFAQSEAIKQLAARGNCVIVGRCSSHILQEAGISTFDVFIYAPLDLRVERISKSENLTENEAKRIIKKSDKARCNYYRKYANAEWGKPHNYHLAISSQLGIDKVVDMIASLVKNN